MISNSVYATRFITSLIKCVIHSWVFSGADHEGGAGHQGRTGSFQETRHEPGRARFPGVPEIWRLCDDPRRQLREAHNRGPPVHGTPAQVHKAGQGPHGQVLWGPLHGLGVLCGGRRDHPPDPDRPPGGNVSQLRSLGEPSHPMHVSSIVSSLGSSRHLLVRQQRKKGRGISSTGYVYFSSSSGHFVCSCCRLGML